MYVYIYIYLFIICVYCMFYVRFGFVKAATKTIQNLKMASHKCPKLIQRLQPPSMLAWSQNLIWSRLLTPTVGPHPLLWGLRYASSDCIWTANTGTCTCNTYWNTSIYTCVLAFASDIRHHMYIYICIYYVLYVYTCTDTPGPIQ